jgi:hypothetical protein
VIDSKSVERALCEKPASTFSQRALEQVRQKVEDFFDVNLLQLIDLARILIERMIPSGRKAR